jgi:4-hydroxy-tetrahydrodipicolinate reductase
MGRMGRALQALAAERGFAVIATLDRGDPITRDSLGGADVAIEFTEPASAPANARACLAAGVPVVVGTTGWLAALPALEAETARAGGRLLWAANFSLGVNAFLAVVAAAGARCATRASSAPRRDAPRGEEGRALGHRARARARGARRLGRAIPTQRARRGTCPGTHALVFDAPFEQIVLTHEARDRRVFAEGALVAARWLAAQTRPGVYTMHDVLAPPPARRRRGGSPRT